MVKHLHKDCFYHLPSGTQVHPCRLIQRDGSIMWKHALLYQNSLVKLPESQAHEAHIIKTAHRMEELNAWVSQDLDPWEFLKPHLWYYPDHPDLSEGIALYFKHTSLSNEDVMEKLDCHIQDHETLNEVEGYLYFRRC